MKIRPVKGTRDLYPELYAPLRRIFDAWRAASIRHGFEEFEGPTLEMLDLYREKSGDELVGQLYRLRDSGDRELALRPEMTPTVARMVAARIQTLARPIKWFCMPKLFRGENVQRGRLREFFQWNVDVIGTDDVAADAEVILVGVEALRDLGLTHEDFVVRISNRRLIAAALRAAGIPEEAHGGAYALMDKAGKLDDEELSRRWGASYGEYLKFETLGELLGASDPDVLGDVIAGFPKLSEVAAEFEGAMQQTRGLLDLLQDFGITEYCNIDLRIVRGLAYYTGPVFEFDDRNHKERTICGGGRYDDLLGRLGKSKEPAVGFGMGDVVLSLMLEKRGLAGPLQRRDCVFVADAADGLRTKLHRLVADLRRKGIRAEFGYPRQSLGKQFKAADKRGCACVVILGDETLERGAVQIKDMTGRAAREASLEELTARPAELLWGDT